MGAETALPCSLAFSGAFEPMRRTLRVLRFDGMGTFLTVVWCFGVRFQPFRVQCQPVFLKPLSVMWLSFFHAGMKACKHEIADCLIGLKRRAFDGLRLGG